jgi:general secretion pathway protein I
MRVDTQATEGGFTLLEVLVAFVIAVLALGLLYRVGIDGLGTAAQAARYQEALARARSHLAALGDSPRPGDRQGDEGDGFHWHVRVVPIASETLPGPGDNRASLLSVSVAISWGRRTVELDSERTVAGAVTEAP